MSDIQARLPDLNDLMQDLQLAKEIAIKNENPNSLVTATMAQAKLLGLDKPTPVHEVNSEIQSLSELIDELSEEANNPRPLFNVIGVSPDDTKTAKTADSSYNGRYVK